MQFGTSFLLVVVASLLIWGATAPSDSVADELDFSASIDTHFHVVSPQNWKNTRLAAMGVIDGPVDGDAALRLLDEAGLAKAVVISSAYLIPDATQAKSENDYIASLVKKNPDRFKGLCSVSVHHAGALEEFERCIDELGLSGLKMHGAADAIDLMNPEHLMLVDSYFKKAAELRKGLPVLIDFNWSDDAQTMAMFQLAMANQETTIILAHALGHHFAEFINV